MKIFEYEYFIKWGAGQGIVIAETKEIAIEMLNKPYSLHGLKLEEIDLSTPQIIDHSWEE